MNMTDMMREAVGVFDDPAQLDAAVAELEVTAFPRPDISVLGSSKDIEKEYGTDRLQLEWLEDSPDTPRSVSIRPEEKIIGRGVIIGCCAYIAGCFAAIAAKNASVPVLLAAIAGGSFAGAALGAAIVFLIAGKIKSETAKKLHKGGLLLWVRTPTPHREKIAQDILRKHGARDVHIHDIA